MTEQSAGPILDGLGVTFDLEDDDLVASSVVISKIVGRDGQVSIHIADSDGLSWIDQMGLLDAARHVIRSSRFEMRDED